MLHLWMLWNQPCLLCRIKVSLCVGTGSAWHPRRNNARNHSLNGCSWHDSTVHLLRKRDSGLWWSSRHALCARMARSHSMGASVHCHSGCMCCEWLGHTGHPTKAGHRAKSGPFTSMLSNMCKKMTVSDCLRWQCRLSVTSCSWVS